jgi:glutamate racemase
MKPAANAPIGIFDSGIGGLTVVKAVQKQLPNEDIIYFGDTARVPYGIKSVNTVRNYALQITDFLLERNVKMVLIACNTVAASAEAEVTELCAKHGVPVLGVIEAGTLAAVELSEKNRKSDPRIGVIGTLATINSGAYETALQEKYTKTTVYSKACPLLVPLAEEGWTDNAVARQTLEFYLKSFKDKHLDALILGCTHYPLFKSLIEDILNDTHTAIIDSADSIAAMAKDHLAQKELLNSQQEIGNFSCFVSDKPQRFQKLAELFLGRHIHKIEIVKL